MAASPFEMVGSIASLGNYSGARTSRKLATKATQQGIRRGLQSGGRRGLSRSQRAINEAFGIARKAKGNAGLKNAAKRMTTGMVNGAKFTARKTGNFAKFLNKNYNKFRKALYEKVFLKIATKTEARWKKLRNKNGLGLKEKKYRDIWDDRLVNRKSPAYKRLWKNTFAKLIKAKKIAKSGKKTQMLSLIRACASAGHSITRAALE